MNVANKPTDSRRRVRHNRRAMPKYEIDRAKLTSLRKGKNYKSDASFWLAATQSSDRSQINKILTGVRKTETWEAIAMAKLLQISTDEIMIILGIESVQNSHKKLIIIGLIQEGGTIVLTAPDTITLEGINYPDAAYRYSGTLLKVADNSMLPRYQVNDLIGHGERRHDVEAFVGKPTIVCLKDGSLMLRTLYGSDRPGYYTLLSANPTFLPITTDAIDWVARIEAIYLAEY